MYAGLQWLAVVCTNQLYEVQVLSLHSRHDVSWAEDCPVIPAHLEAEAVADASHEEGSGVASAAGGSRLGQAQLREHLHKLVRPHGTHVHARALRWQHGA